MKKVHFAIFLILFGFSGYSQKKQFVTNNDTTTYPYWIKMMQNPKANYYQTVRAFNLYWQGREITRGSGYKPFKRWEYYWNVRLNPDGTRLAGDDTYRKVSAFLFERNRDTSTYQGNWVNLGPVPNRETLVPDSLMETEG